MAKIGVILSGCGVYDGAEIHESVAVLLALDKAGAEAVCAAPDVEQREVIDHLAGKPVEEKRNVLVESARIARGKISDLASLKAEDIDAVILPGGFGAAKNLSDFAIQGAACSVNPETARLLREMRAAGKPIGALCIAPAVLAKVLGDEAPVLTIGDDPDTAKALEAMGAKHSACAVGDVVVDGEKKIVSTPAYMLARRIGEVFTGAEKLVGKVLELAGAETAGV